MIPILELTGTAREIGRRHGEELRRPIRELTEIRWELLRRRCRLRDRETLRELARQQWQLTAHHFPASGEELEGIREGAGVSREDLVVLNNYTDFRDIRESPPASGEEGCTSLYVRQRGRAWLAQTWDMHGTAEPYVIGLLLPGKAVLTVAGCLALAGLNHHGLGVAVNNLYSADARPGVMWPALVRAMLDRADLEAMGEVLVGTPLGSGHNYLLGGLSGCRNWETSATRSRLTFRAEAEEARFHHTNHYLDPEMKEVEGELPARSTSRERYDLCARALAELKAPDTGELLALLSSHRGYPRSLCSHLDSEDPDASKTCGGMVAALHERAVLVWKGCLKEGNAPLRLELPEASGER